MAPSRSVISASCDDDARSALRALTAAPEATPGGLSRRRFVQGALAGGALLAGSGSLLGGLASSADAVIGPTGVADPILVVILLGGGNDGLNMVPPVASGAYRDLRGDIAIAESAGLGIGSGLALHPNMTTIKGLWDKGQLAIVPGLGHGGGLSHFDSMANWMAGGPPAPPVTGWLGRWLDDASATVSDPLLGVSLGSGVPLHLIGRRTAASAIPTDVSNLFGADRSDESEARLGVAATSFAAAPSGLGAWGDAWSGVLKTATDLSGQLQPLAEPDLPDGELARPLTLAARLLNTGVRTRVVGVSGGDHDTHAGEPGQHAERMAELDAGIAAFYATAKASVAARTLFLVFSEFGRRPEVNSSSGTDHGSATTCLVIGQGAKGGIAAPFPSLTDLDDDGNLKPQTDFRSLYAALLDGWLGGDSAATLGGTFAKIDVLKPGGATGFRPMRRLSRSQRRAASAAAHKAAATTP